MLFPYGNFDIRFIYVEWIEGIIQIYILVKKICDKVLPLPQEEHKGFVTAYTDC